MTRLSAMLPLLSLCSCAAGLGEFCLTDRECEPGLRCTSRDAGRGVCTYPEGIPDTRSSGSDAPADLGRDRPLPRDGATDRTLDWRGDGARDQTGSDLRPAPPPDLARSDLRSDTNGDQTTQ